MWKHQVSPRNNDMRGGLDRNNAFAVLMFGWMILLGLIPVVGGIIMLVFMCLEGTRGANRFGPDPKSSETPLVA